MPDPNDRPADGFPRGLTATAAMLGATAVTAGAFGAHALKGSLTPTDLEIFETAARYQMYHALAIFAALWLADRTRTNQTPVTDRSVASGGYLPAWLFILGTLIFSGSLYILVLAQLRWFGAITPIGGTLLIVGWLLLAWQAWTVGHIRRG